MTRFWTIVFAVGAAQGVFLCAVLLLRRTGNSIATRLLSALVGLATAMIIAGALIQTVSAPFDTLLMFININTDVAIGPLILLFTRSLVDPGRRLARRDLIRFIPFVSGIILWTCAWWLLGDGGRRAAFLDGAIVPVYMLFKVVWLFGNIVVAYRILGSDLGKMKIQPSGRKSGQLSWLRYGLLLLSVMVGAIYLTGFSGRFGVMADIPSDPLGSLVLAVMIYLVTFMVMQRPGFLALRRRPSVDPEKASQAARLTSFLETERPWLSPDLSLGELAVLLELSENQLSAVIGDVMSTNFYALVSTYRLAEFEKLATDSSHHQRSVLELAYEAGFNSKASFYRAFREAHEMTPTAFRKSAQS